MLRSFLFEGAEFPQIPFAIVSPVKGCFFLICGQMQLTEGGIMATDARKMSESGYYHAIARGNGRQLIFEDDDDRLLLLQKLEEVFAQ